LGKNSIEKMFIKSGLEGDLVGNGSSRWRQRAYYDFLKDIISSIRNIPIIRISIYDKFQGKTFDQLLTNNENKVLDEFLNSIPKRYRC